MDAWRLVRTIIFLESQGELARLPVVIYSDKFPAHPADIIFKCHIFLQAWAPLGKTSDEDCITEIMEQIKLIMVNTRQGEATT